MIARDRLVGRGLIVVEQGGARVGQMVRTSTGSTIAPIPKEVAGSLLAGGAVAAYFFGAPWVAAGAAAGAIYFLVFMKDDAIRI